MREALFSMLGQGLGGTTFLDAFGGAGLIGIEAWSRGATVTVVERDPRLAASLRRRGDEVGATWEVLVGDVLRLANGLPRFDVVFVDPPYASDPEPVVQVLAPLAGRFLVYESQTGGRPVVADGMDLYRVRTYGRSTLTLFERGL